MRALWSALVIRSAEYVQHLAFELAGEVLVAPSLAHEALGAGAVALQQQRARERELALGGDGPVLAEMRPHGRGIEAVLPERRLGAAPQEADARPARIFGDEGDIAGEVDLVVVAAQDRPFDQLACDRIADRALQLACPRRLAFARLRDRLLDGGDIGRGGRRRGGDARAAPPEAWGGAMRAGGARFRGRRFVSCRRQPSALAGGGLGFRRGGLVLRRCRLVLRRGRLVFRAPRPCPSAQGSKPARPSGRRPPSSACKANAEGTGNRERGQKSRRAGTNQAVILAVVRSLSDIYSFDNIDEALTGRPRDHSPRPRRKRGKRWPRGARGFHRGRRSRYQLRAAGPGRPTRAQRIVS